MNNQEQVNEEYQPTIQEVVSVTIAQIVLGLMLQDVPDDILENMFNQVAVTNGVSRSIFMAAFDSDCGIGYIRETGEQWLNVGSDHLLNILNHERNQQRDGNLISDGGETFARLLG
jgi:hypothetical protein